VNNGFEVDIGLLVVDLFLLWKVYQHLVSNR
jgi:hypothetical protein